MKLLAEALYAPALLIYRHHQPIVRGSADLAHQLTQLLRIVEVAGKQDQSANQRVFQNFAFFCIQLVAGDI